MRIWLPAVLALFVGFVAGFLVPRGESSSPRVAAPQDEPGLDGFRDDADESSLARVDETDTADEPAPTDATRSADDTPDHDESAKAEDAQVEKIIEALKGDAELRGVAVYPDGTPAKGITLIAEAAGGTPELPGASGWLDELTSHRCVTNESGEFVFTGMIRTSYLVKCESSTLYASLFDWGFQRVALSPGSFMRLLIRPTTRIDVSVEDGDGNEVEAARVIVKVRDTRGIESVTEFKTWTQSDRTVHAPPGRVVLEAQSWTDRSMQDTEVVHVEAGETSSVTLQLLPLEGVHLRVEQTAHWYGRPQCYLLPKDEADSFDAERAADRSGTGSPSRSVDGKQVFHDLTSGEYVLFICYENLEVRRESIVYEGGKLEVTIELEPLDPSRHLLLRAIRPDGSPTVESTVYVESMRIKARAADGVWWFYVPEDRDNHEPFSVTAKVPGEGVISKEVEAILGTVHDLHLQEVGSVTVTVSGLTGELRHQLELMVVPEQTGEPVPHVDGRPRYIGSRFVGVGPRIAEESRIEDVPGGAAEVVVYLSLHSSYFHRGPEIVRRRVNVVRGENEFAIELPAFHSVTVRADNDSDAREVQLVVDNEHSTGHVEDGVAQWPCVPEGAHRLLSRAGGMKLDVRGDVDVEWRPRPLNVLVWMKLDSDGILERAGLQPDDVIRTINGQTLAGSDEMRAAMQDATQAASTRFGIERGDESFVVDISGTDLDEALKSAEYSVSYR